MTEDIDEKNNAIASQISAFFRDACHHPNQLSPASAGRSSVHVISIFVACAVMISTWYDSEAKPEADFRRTPPDFQYFALNAIAGAENESEKKLLATADGYIEIISVFYQQLRAAGLVKANLAHS